MLGACVLLTYPSLLVWQVGLVLFVGFYALSLAPIFFVLLHECFSEAAAPLASGLFTSLTFVGGALVDTSFPSLIDGIGVFGTFGILVAVCIFSGLVVLLALPETKGRTLYEVRRLLGGGSRIISFHDGAVHDLGSTALLRAGSIQRPRSVHEARPPQRSRATSRSTASTEEGGAQDDMADDTLLRKHSSAVVLAA